MSTERVLALFTISYSIVLMIAMVIVTWYVITSRRRDKAVIAAMKKLLASDYGKNIIESADSVRGDFTASTKTFSDGISSTLAPKMNELNETIVTAIMIDALDNIDNVEDNDVEEDKNK